jgi:molybdopterin-binding protein
MQISARNVWPGTVKQVTPGQVNDEVLVELDGGVEVVSIITKGSVQNLALAPGSRVQVVVKASNVMIALD